MARPSNYNQQMAQEICDRLVDGDSLREICRDPAMPDKKTVLRWVLRFPEFAAQYASARDMQADAEFDEMEEMAASATPETVQVVRLQIDVRKWVLSRKSRKKYGDSMAIGGDSESPLNVIIQGKDASV